MILVDGRVLWRQVVYWTSNGNFFQIKESVRHTNACRIVSDGIKRSIKHGSCPQGLHKKKVDICTRLKVQEECVPCCDNDIKEGGIVGNGQSNYNTKTTGIAEVTLS